MIFRRAIPFLLVFLALTAHAVDLSFGGRRQGKTWVKNITNIPVANWSPDTFADGEYTSNPTWTEVGVSNASWGVSGGRAVLTRSNTNASGGLWAEAPEFGGGVGLTFKPTDAVSYPTESYLNLKACTVQPTIVGPESGCYTAKFFVQVNSGAMPGFGECMFSFTSMQLYRDTTRIAYSCDANIWGFTDHTLALTVSGGTVTASFDGSTVTASASDSTYSAFTYVGFGLTDWVAYSAGPWVTEFDNISYTE